MLLGTNAQLCHMSGHKFYSLASVMRRRSKQHVLRELARATGQRHNSSHLDQLLGERLRVDVRQQRHGGGPRRLAQLPSQQLTPKLQPAVVAAAIQHAQLQAAAPRAGQGCMCDPALRASRLRQQQRRDWRTNDSCGPSGGHCRSATAA